MPVANSNINLTCTTEGCDAFLTAINNSQQITFTELRFYTEYGLNPSTSTYSSISSYTPLLTINNLQVVTDSSTTPNTVRISGFYSGELGSGGDIFEVKTVGLIGSLNSNNILVALDSRSSSEAIYTLQGNGSIAVDIILAIDNADATAAIQVSSINILPIPATTSSVGTVALATVTDITNGNDGTAQMPKVLQPSALSGDIVCNTLSTSKNQKYIGYFSESDFEDWGGGASVVFHDSMSNIDFTSDIVNLTLSIDNQIIYGISGTCHATTVGEPGYTIEGSFVYNGSEITVDFVFVTSYVLSGIDIMPFTPLSGSNFTVELSISASTDNKIISDHGQFVTANVGSLNVGTINATEIAGKFTTAYDSTWPSGSLILGGYQLSSTSGDAKSISRGTLLDSGLIYQNINISTGSIPSEPLISLSSLDIMALSSTNKWRILNDIRANEYTVALALFMKE